MRLSEPIQVQKHDKLAVARGVNTNEASLCVDLVKPACGRDGVTGRSRHNDLAAGSVARHYI